MEVPRLMLLLVFCAVHAEAVGIIFPDQLRHSEGDVCTIHEGKTGICERACRHSASQGASNLCGRKDSTFLFCCEGLPVKPDRIIDISPPTVNFPCGRNTKNKLILNEPTPRPILPPRHESTKDQGSTVKDFVFQAVGGVDTEENAWPWMALLGKKDAQGIIWFCGGVLINEQWVLSALHCFLDQITDVVRLGEHDYDSLNEAVTHQDFGVTETVLYPDYTFPQAYHDLALLRLDSKVNIQSFISPVCLPWGQESDTVLTDQVVTLTGWGDTKFGGLPSSILQEVNITVFPPVQCDLSYSNLPHYKNTWPRGIGQETVCAGDPNGGRDACQGDSGGPIVSQDARGRYVLSGIVSRGYGCGNVDYPGLYANLRHPPYLVWIKKVAFT